MENYQAADSLACISIADGVAVHYVHGEAVTVAVADLGPAVVVPRHQHMNEQLGVVLRGSITVELDTGVRVLGPGESYSFPGNVPHQVTAGPEGAVLAEGFTPVRADWNQLPAVDGSAVGWPIQA